MLIVPAYAQETKRDLAYMESQKREERLIGRTSQKAEEKKTVEEVKRLSYSEILAQPDNIEVNYQYARQQIAQNDLLGAAATLERILILNPNLHQVRLLYAVLLFRLDNLTEAKLALDRLQNVEMPAEVRKEVDTYLKLIKKRKRRTHLAVQETIGYGYDTNRNAAPSSKNRLFMDTMVNLSGTDLKRGDAHLLNVATVDLSHDLGFQAGHELIGSFTHFLQEQQHVNSLDLQSFDYYVGTRFKSRFVNFTPIFRATNVFLSSENFLRTQGGHFIFDRNFGKLDVFTNVRVERQDFMNISENATNHDRKGVRTELESGASYMICPSMRVGASLGYGHKTAKQEFDAYDSFFIRTNHTWLLGQGQFLTNGVTYDRDNYFKADSAIAGQTRKDNFLIYDVTYGAPLTFFLIGKILPDPVKDITASFTYGYYRSLSNITNYTYTNNQFQGMLTKRWEF
jgi:tetratricopeptide (TPR) repeat protein